MSFTLTTEDEVDSLSGKNANSNVTSDQKRNWVAQAEGYLCSLIRYDLLTNEASLSGYAKGILSEYCARYAAMQVVLYDMSGWTNRIEAEDIVQAHQQRMRDIEKLLLDSRVQTFLTKES